MIYAQPRELNEQTERLLPLPSTHTPTPLTHPLHTQEGTETHNIMGVIVGGAAASQEARLQICLKQAHFVS